MLARPRKNPMIREPEEEKGSKMRKHEREPKRSRGSIPPCTEGGALNEARVGNQASFIRKCPRIFLLSVAAASWRKGYETGLRTLRCVYGKTILLHGGRSPLLREYSRTSIFKVASWLDRLHFASLYHRVWNDRERREEKRGEAYDVSPRKQRSPSNHARW